MAGNFRGQHKGDWTIDAPVIIHGQVTGDVRILPNIDVVHHGQINGDLIVEPAASIVIHGMVNGAVRNLGGKVVIHGWVDELIDAAGAESQVMPGSRVRGKGGAHSWND